MKKILLLILLLIILITGCSSNKLDKYKQIATCETGIMSIDEDDEEFKYEMKNYSYQVKMGYDDLSDNNYTIDVLYKYFFDEYEKAEIYYNKLKEDNKDIIVDIDIDEDINTKTTTVTFHFTSEVNESVRDQIHKAQDAGFECKTTTSSKKE